MNVGSRLKVKLAVLQADEIGGLRVARAVVGEGNASQSNCPLRKKM